MSRYNTTIEIRIYDVATVWLDASLEICTVRPAFDVGEAWLAFQLERHVLPIVRMMRGYAVFHAGAVRTDRGAVLLLADGQGGKSTTAALLLADGAAFISDDQTAVTTAREEIGTPWLRLRRPRRPPRSPGCCCSVRDPRPAASRSSPSKGRRQ